MPRSLETSPTQTACPRSAQEKKPAADRRIRDMVPEDKENFLSMVRMFYQSPAVESAVDEQHFETTFHAALSHSPYIRILMLEDRGQLVGYAQLSFTYSNEAGGMAVLIEELYISRACRGRGMGHAFFSFLEKEYPDVKRFRLEVHSDNVRAIRLYRSLGYSTLRYKQMIRDR